LPQRYRSRCQVFLSISLNLLQPPSQRCRPLEESCSEILHGGWSLLDPWSLRCKAFCKNSAMKKSTMKNNEQHRQVRAIDHKANRE
jgi:hypothetical protein